MSTDGWSGRRVTKARAVVRGWLPLPCGRCGEPVMPEDEFVVGHIRSRLAYPELMWVVTNWQPEHKGCSEGTGHEATVEKARREGAEAAVDALARAGQIESARSVLADLDGALFPLSDVGSAAFMLPLSPPGARRSPTQPVQARPELEWDPDDLRRHAWTADLAHPPEDAAPPLWMSPVHPAAVCSYAWSGCEHLPDGVDLAAVAWIEREERKSLRWWQRLATVRQLEHRDDGTLCWPVVLESAPRRAGKSVRIRGVALWRMTVGPALFGERQEIVHTGSDIAVCRKVQKEAWRWCLARGWVVSKANGKEAVESEEGDVWVVRAQDATYGWDTTLGLVDEGWDVKPDTVSEGLEPSLLERSSPQLHITSTAHRRATSMMRGRLSSAIAADDGETLVLVWAARADADPGDPATWRAASPHWSEARHKLVAAKHIKAAAGEADPEADDPDPMAGFTAQYLNRWRLTARREVKGDPLVSDTDWSDLTALPDDCVPDAAAIESHYSQGITLALAWRESGVALVSATDHRDLKSAVAELRRSGFRRSVLVGKALVDDPALRGLAKTPMSGKAGAAVDDLARLLKAGGLQHDGGAHLTGQVLEVRTTPGVDGARVTSRGRSDAVKAAAWAASAARSKSSSGGLIVLPTGV